MFNHHNPTFAQPLMDELLNTLGSKWSDSSYGNDTCACISCTLSDGTDVSIHIPNSDVHGECTEEFDEYSIGIDGEHVDCYTHQSEVTAKALEIINERDNTFYLNK